MIVTVTSDPGRDDLYAEIFFGRVQWAEVRISPSTGEPELVIYAPVESQSWAFPLEAAQRALEEAKVRLLKVEHGGQT